MKLAPVVTEKARYGIFMKINRVLAVCTAITIPHLAMAKLPFTNDEFGMVERGLSYCAELKPESAAQYREIDERYVGNAPAKELAEARETSAYKASYRSNGDLLTDLPKQYVIATCNEVLQTKDVR